MNTRKVEIELKELVSLKSSVASRLRRLKIVHVSRYSNNFHDREVESPIAKCGLFAQEIEEMESILSTMDKRLQAATITIEI